MTAAIDRLAPIIARGVQAAHPQLDEHRPDRVADRADEDRQRAQQLRPLPATSIPTSAITPAKPIPRPTARIGVGRSEGSKRSDRTVTISGTEAMMIAASDEATCTSPSAISGNGIETSMTA